MYEVSHGPYIVDNNILLSKRPLAEFTDGGAFLHNIIVGDIMRLDDMRFTPYLLNHSTDVRGIQTITEGDHRFFNNILVGRDDPKYQYGLVGFDESKRPIYAENNLLLNGALPMTGRTQDWVEKSVNPNLRLEETPEGEVYLISDVDLQELSAFRLETDYFGHERSASPIVGPMEKLSSTKRIKVWPPLYE
ncbi:MAG: hypothetical protein ACI30I_08715 [Parabacteroides sp.]